MKEKHSGKKRGGNQAAKDLYTGKIEIVRSGMGFVTIKDFDRDVLIKREHLRTALSGDEVRITITRGGKHGSRAEGRVEEVLTRRLTEFTGRLEVKAHFAFLLPDKNQVPFDIFIPLHLLHDAKDGDHAVVKIVDWNEKAKNPVGEVLKVITEDEMGDIAMKEILTDANFPLEFPDEVLEEAARHSPDIHPDDLRHRRDMRGELTFTIDPVDARDFDDALSVKKISADLFEIGVHIADVDHFMPAGSALDEEAYKRATSVYLPDRVLPMLPEHLSNQLCSLRPDEDKYTFSAIFKISKTGVVKESWIGRTVIRSNRRFTYEEVQEILEGADGDHKKELLLLNNMAQSLRQRRFAKGAINFSSQEVRFQLDEKGKPIGIVIKESKAAHQLIEEFMLLANRTVAEYVSKIEVKGKPLPFPYRIHNVPDEAKLEVFALFASRFGHKFNLNTPASIATSFNEMLEAAQGHAQQHVLETLGIRTMAKAVYSTENIGHYGLGFEHYCHFTSPIRRYPDVLVHRILQQCLDGAPKPIKDLEEQCVHCSERERAAMDSERAANKYKQVEFMQQYIGEEFEAVISGVAPFGFWAETVDHKCEGLVSLQSLRDMDDFDHHESEYALIGRNTGVRLRMGDNVKIRVDAASLEKRQLDYSLTAISEDAYPKKRGSSKGKKAQADIGMEDKPARKSDIPGAKPKAAAASRRKNKS